MRNAVRCIPPPRPPPPSHAPLSYTPQVQLAMHEVLLGELRAYDGSSGSFLAMMRYRLRLGAKEIHERKFYLAQQMERRATFAEDTRGLSTAAVVACPYPYP